MLGLLAVKDWAYLGIIAALIGFGVYWDHHERGIGEQKIEAADKAATEKAEAAAARENAAVAADYQAKLKETESAYELDRAEGAAHADGLAASLRTHQDYRCPRPVLPGPAAASKPSDAATVASSDAAIAAATQRVFDAAAADAAQLSALEAERESLTGK
jgi:hypothetical protein